jgi:hypothetical protein
MNLRYTPPADRTFDPSWSFNSPAGTTGTFYIGGFYLFGSTSFVPAGGTTLGTANIAYGAHAFIVLGATSTNMVVRITGTSVDDSGARTTSDTQDLDTSSGALNDYFETTKKWIGQISFSLLSGTGVAVNSGLCKYWDNHNRDFRVIGLEVTGTGGGNDSAPNFSAIRHRPTGWTYNVGSTPTRPSSIIDMNTDYNTEIQLATGQSFAWKRVGLSEVIAGGLHEGFIGEIVTTANRAIESLDWTLSILSL